jgi:hypothetical protein
MAIIETSNLHTYRDKTPQYQGTFRHKETTKNQKLLHISILFTHTLPKLE